jgi:hypothetical protein
MAQRQAIVARIEAEAENRDAGEPETVSDIYATGRLGTRNSLGGY